MKHYCPKCNEEIELSKSSWDIQVYNDNEVTIETDCHNCEWQGLALFSFIGYEDNED